MGEFDLIQRFFKRPAIASASAVLGIGDDCALLQPAPGMQLTICCAIFPNTAAKRP